MKLLKILLISLKLWNFRFLLNDWHLGLWRMFVMMPFHHHLIIYGWEKRMRKCFDYSHVLWHDHVHIVHEEECVECEWSLSHGVREGAELNMCWVQKLLIQCPITIFCQRSSLSFYTKEGWNPNYFLSVLAIQPLNDKKCC